MAGPLHTVWVRHGESEHNLAVRASKHDMADLIPPEVFKRPDYEHPLTELGHEQALIAHDWMTENIGDPDTYFDAHIFTTAVRGRQTAAHLAPNAKWRPHDAIIEQDWGEFGAVPYHERAKRFPHTTEMRRLARFFARLDGGESPFDQLFRVRDMHRTLNTKYVDKKVLLAAHGGTLAVVRYSQEHMLPEEFHAVEEDRTQMLGNCAILEFSRVNPDDPEDVVPYNRWRRITQPDDFEKSPFGGEWVELPGRREYNGADLMRQAAAFPSLISPELYAKIPPKTDDLPRS